MRFPFRRHRGSQVEDVGPNFRMHIVAPEGDPAEMARAFSYALDGRRPPERLTTRQVLTETLLRDVVLADHYDRVPALVDSILLDLDAAGLEIVAREDVE